MAQEALSRLWQCCELMKSPFSQSKYYQLRIWYIRPTLSTSSPAAWALRATDKLPTVAARLVVLIKLRRET